ALKYFSETTQNDAPVVQLCVKSRPWAIQYSSTLLWDDDKVMACVASVDGLPALKYASKRLRACTKLVRMAVQSNGLAIRFASEDLRADREIAQLAIRNNPYAYPKAVRLLPREFRQNRQLLLEVLTRDGDAIRYCSSRMKSD
ncbi:unnamed protein product, partial [Amoebophrya sp. A120]